MSRGNDFCHDVTDCLASEVGVIFDVGANDGTLAKNLRDRFLSARIYCFEPVGTTYEQLIANTTGISGLHCFNIGFSDFPGTHTLFLQPNPAWNSIEKNIDCGRGSVSIMTETIDQFCLENEIGNIDLLKTDTEGHDLRVLRGAESMLKEGRISAVYSEVGFYDEDCGHTNFCNFLKFMQNNEFQLYNIYGIASTFINDPANPDYPWANALFIKNSIVRAKYGASYFDWLREIGLLPNKQDEV
jgi:FkbM family methyltransferase